MAIIVQKYGGTSVGNLERIINVARNVSIEYNQGNKLVIVVSAMSGETDRLISLAKQISKNLKTRDIDMIASTGEQVTISLLSLALQSIGVSAVSYCGWQIPIITNNDYTQARIKYIDTKKIITALANNDVVVIAGFQGMADTGDITTLGRGGSDTSAVAIAVALKASECQIYTDVNGVYNADPNRIATAKRIEKINGISMLEASSLGANVLHVRSCELAYRYKTNIRVLSTFAPQDQGSLIMNQSELENYPIISLSEQNHQALLSVKIGKDISLSYIIDNIYKSCNVDMLKVDQGSISFVTEESNSSNMQSLLKANGVKDCKCINNLTKLSLIGSGFRSNNLLNQKVWQLLDGIEVFAVSHNEISISLLVHSLDATVTRNKLVHLL